MFAATYLGWQGWLLGSRTTHLLVDPLLTDDVGRGPPPYRATWLFPQERVFDWEEFPSVDAIFFSHEHEDHFSVRTLVRVQRSVPIYLSSRSSCAARSIVHELGFQLILVEPGRVYRTGDLEWRAFAPDHRAKEMLEEWDTLAYFVWDADGHGAFFTSVDVFRTGEMNARVAEQRALRPQGFGEDVLCFEEFEMALWAPDQEGPQSMAAMHRPSKLREAELEPHDAFAAMRRGAWSNGKPGRTLRMKNGRLATVERACPFLGLGGTRPRTRPPQVERGLSDADFADIECGLTEMARYLYGSQIFRALYSLDAAALGSRKPTFLLLLRAGADDFYPFEYDPISCSFVSASPTDPSREYMGVVSLSVSHFYLLIRGIVEPRALLGEIDERWSLKGVSFEREILWPMFHPLRRPGECLARYRNLAAEEKNAPCLIRFAGSKSLAS